MRPEGAHGCVTLSFNRADEFALTCEANQPEGDDYSAAIKDAVQSTLAELSLPFEVACTLERDDQERKVAMARQAITGLASCFPPEKPRQA